jgi:hypothetical protein
MTDFIPYFAGLITLMFGAGCYLSLQEAKRKKN